MLKTDWKDKNEHLKGTREEFYINEHYCSREFAECYANSNISYLISQEKDGDWKEFNEVKAKEKSELAAANKVNDEPEDNNSSVINE